MKVLARLSLHRWVRVVTAILAGGALVLALLFGTWYASSKLQSAREQRFIKQVVSERLGSTIAQDGKRGLRECYVQSDKTMCESILYIVDRQTCIVHVINWLMLPTATMTRAPIPTST
jgi:hypothetical protein